MKSPQITYTPTQKAVVPQSWKQAAGILRASAKRNLAELKKMRREWNKRV